MSDTTYQFKPALQEKLEHARIGDPELNTRTRNDPELAYTIAHYIEAAYEIGLERAAQATFYEDEIIRHEIGKYALEWFVVANERAAKVAASAV
jgi:hypothetical protein